MGDSYPNQLGLGEVCYNDSYMNPNRIWIPTSFWRTKGHYKAMRYGHGEHKS